jgi:hypothetical protein
LGVDGGAARLRRWRALADGAQRSAQRLTIRWRVDAGGASELEALVAAERDCCAFVSRSLSREDLACVLEITADATRPEDLDAIASLFAATCPTPSAMATDRRAPEAGPSAS